MARSPGAPAKRPEIRLQSALFSSGTARSRGCLETTAGRRTANDDDLQVDRRSPDTHCWAALYGQNSLGRPGQLAPGQVRRSDARLNAPSLTVVVRLPHCHAVDREAATGRATVALDRERRQRWPPTTRTTPSRSAHAFICLYAREDTSRNDFLADASVIAPLSASAPCRATRPSVINDCQTKRTRTGSARAFQVLARDP